MSIRNLANIVTETRESLDRIPDSDAVTLDKSIVRALLDAFSALPADDVGAALDHLDALNESGRIQYADYVALHDMVSRIEVRPHGTVTDAEVEDASQKFAASILVPERETRLAQSAFIAGVEWRERAAAREARS